MNLIDCTESRHAGAILEIFNEAIINSMALYDYLHPQHRGQGLGKVSLNALIEEAKRRQVHTLIGGIDATNVASMALHTQAGFIEADIIKQAAYKFDRWLDLAFYPLILSTPEHPVAE